MTELIRTKQTPLQQAWLHSPCNVLYELCKVRPGQNVDIEIGGTVFALVQSAETARAILRNRDGTFAKYFGQYAELFGDSRLTVSDDRWRRLRDLSQPYIIGADIDQLAQVTRQQFNAVASDLIAQSRGAPIMIDDHIDLAAASVISEVVLGFPIADWGGETISDIRKILRLASWENFPTVRMSPFERGILTLDAEEARQALQARFGAMLAARPDAKRSSLINAIAEADTDFVDQFGEISTLLFAGFDTTASAISWAMFLLSRDEAMQSRLRAQVSGLADDTSLQAKDILALHDLNAFLIEALRIFPPIPVLSRIAQTDEAIDGLAIPANRRILLSIIGVHHDPAAFPKPFEVDIQRHPNGALTREATENFLPFGDGKRICPGTKIANLEALTAIAVLLDRATFDPLPPKPLNLRWEASMRQAEGTKLTVRGN